MTGSHEVRGSIPLGSTNYFNSLLAAHRLPPLGSNDLSEMGELLQPILMFSLLQ